MHFCIKCHNMYYIRVAAEDSRHISILLSEIADM